MTRSLMQPRIPLVAFAMSVHCCLMGNLLSSRKSKETQVLLCHAPFHPVRPQPGLVPGVIRPQVHNTVLPETAIGPFLQPAEVLLNGSTTIYLADQPFLLNFLWPENMLRVCLVKPSRSLTTVLVPLLIPECSTSDWLPTGLHTSACNSLRLAAQVVFSLPHCLFI